MALLIHVWAISTNSWQSNGGEALALCNRRDASFRQSAESWPYPLNPLQTSAVPFC
jgi:hypothetical protein